MDAEGAGVEAQDKRGRESLYEKHPALVWAALIALAGLWRIVTPEVCNQAAAARLLKLSGGYSLFAITPTLSIVPESTALVNCGISAAFFLAIVAAPIVVTRSVTWLCPVNTIILWLLHWEYSPVRFSDLSLTSAGVQFSMLAATVIFSSFPVHHLRKHRFVRWAAKLNEPMNARRDGEAGERGECLSDLAAWRAYANLALGALVILGVYLLVPSAYGVERARRLGTFATGDHAIYRLCMVDRDSALHDSWVSIVLQNERELLVHPVPGTLWAATLGDASADDAATKSDGAAAEEREVGRAMVLPTLVARSAVESITMVSVRWLDSEELEAELRSQVGDDTADGRIVVERGVERASSGGLVARVRVRMEEEAAVDAPAGSPAPQALTSNGEEAAGGLRPPVSRG